MSGASSGRLHKTGRAPRGTRLHKSDLEVPPIPAPASAPIVVKGIVDTRAPIVLPSQRRMRGKL